MDPPRFPTSEAELADWSVYADWLPTAGDRRGELIARDLALPSMPDTEQLRMFHSIARSMCRERDTTFVGWTLGHARTMQVTWPYPAREMNHGTLANARDFLRSPVAARLEWFASDAPRPTDVSAWARVATALPVSCTHVAFQTDSNRNPVELGPAIECLPETVRRISVFARRSRLAHWSWVSDRFDEIDVGNLVVVADVHAVLARALDSSPKVQLRARHADERLTRGHDPLDWRRYRFADPGEIALVRAGRVRVGRRPDLVALQRRFGPIGVRAQLARTVPERFQTLADIVRRPDAWTIKGAGEEVLVNDVAIADNVVVPIRDGDRLTLRGDVHRFVTSDVDGACRRALAERSTQ